MPKKPEAPETPTAPAGSDDLVLVAITGRRIGSLTPNGRKLLVNVIEQKVPWDDVATVRRIMEGLSGMSPEAKALILARLGVKGSDSSDDA